MGFKMFAPIERLRTDYKVWCAFRKLEERLEKIEYGAKKAVVVEIDVGSCPSFALELN